MSTSTISKNAFALLLVQFSNYIAPLLLLPYLSRVLGVDGFGLIMVTLSLCALCYLFTDYGFNLSASYWIAKHRTRKRKVGQYIGAVFIIKMVIFFILILSLSIYYFFGKGILSTRGDLLLLVGIVALSQAYQPIWFYQGIERMRNVTIFMVTSKLSHLLIVLTLVKQTNDEDYVLVSLIVSNLLATIIAIRFIFKEGYGIGLPSKVLVRYVLRTSTDFFISRVAVGIYTTASTFIVGNVAGLVQAATYSAAEKLYQAGQSITSPISQALYPHLARSKNNTLLFKFIMFTLPIMIIGCIIIGVYADFFLALIYGKSFSNAEEVLRIFLVCTVVTFVSINFGYPAFAALGKVRIANKTVLLGGIIQSILLCYLYLQHEITSVNVAYCVLITESAVFASRVILLSIFTRRRNLASSKVTNV